MSHATRRALLAAALGTEVPALAANGGAVALARVLGIAAAVGALEAASPYPRSAAIAEAVRHADLARSAATRHWYASTARLSK